MGEDEIVRLFNAKIKLERKQYKKRVLQLAPERIYQRAYQINCRENIAETLLEKSGEMKSEVLRCLLVLPNVIQFFYARWMGKGDSFQLELEKQHVDMYALTDRVNQLFFGILLLDEQLKQNSLLQEDLGRTHKQVADYIANGIATPSDLDAVSVEQLNTRQHRVELETTRRAYLSMLAAFTGKDLSSETVLLKPAAEENIDRQMNNRPELRWYDAQGEQLRQQEAALNTRLMPRFGLFVQRGIRQSGVEYAER